MAPLADATLSLLRGAYAGTLIGGFIFFLLWEGGAPRVAFGSGPERRRHVLRNLGMLLLVVLVADLVVGAWLLGTVTRIGAPSPGWLSRFELEWPALLVIGIVAIDLFQYWWHRACHAVPWLWRLHRVHHSDTHLDVTTGARFHALESSLGIALLVGAMLLAGIPLWVELVRTIAVNPLILAQHANVSFPRWLERAARPVLATPEVHRVHHSRLRAEQDSNFGQMLSVWDRLFGTWRTPPASSRLVGVNGMDAARFQTVDGMCATPFLRVRDEA